MCDYCEKIVSNGLCKLCEMTHWSISKKTSVVTNIYIYLLLERLLLYHTEVQMNGIQGLEGIRHKQTQHLRYNLIFKLKVTLATKVTPSAQDMTRMLSFIPTG